MSKIKESLVAQRIKVLEKIHGTITPKILVEDARDPKSPIHNTAGFEWNQKKAAYTAWIEHARKLIATVRWQITTTVENYKSVGYMRDPRKKPKEQGYVSMDKLRKDKKWAREAIELEIKQVLARFERLREIAEPLGLQARVDRMIADLQAFERKMAA